MSDDKKLNSDAKEFLLHLYDKLWENMGAKEQRLWNYLSVYGAAVALALGAGQYAGIQLYAALVVLALTAWAVLIVVNANWWYQRNLLMVTQIETKFVVTGAVDGVIPKSYRNPDFDFDRLYAGSVLILLAIAVLLYLRTLWYYHTLNGAMTIEAAWSIVAFYFFFLTSITYVVCQYESYIHSFYKTKLMLLSEAGQSGSHIDENIKSQEKDAFSKHGWRFQGLGIIVMVMFFFDWLDASRLHPYRFFIALVLQTLVIVFYVLILKCALDNRSWRDWLLRFCFVAAVVGSSILLLSPWNQKLIAAP